MKNLTQYIIEKLHPSKFKKEKEIYFDSFKKFADNHQKMS